MRSQANHGTPLLQVENLGVTFFTPRGTVRAVRDASLEVHRGEVMGVACESGCGKSTTAFAVMGYLPGITRVEGRYCSKAGMLCKWPRRTCTICGATA